MRDFLPKDLAKRRAIESVVRELFRLYGYEEIETPTVEPYELFAAKSGEEIRQRMYVFKDLKGRMVVLRPEMTASVARVVATKLRTAPKPLRLGYIANCFRYDEPQRGRYREFWQAGFELIGSSQPEADAEILLLSSELMDRLGFSEYVIKVGHVGLLRGVLGAEGLSEEEQNHLMGLVDKAKYEEAIGFLESRRASNDCVKLVREVFELGWLSHGEAVEAGRKLFSSYSEADHPLENLEEILSLMLEAGVDSKKLSVSLGFARGLEYYTGMIFEVFVPQLDIALNGGGRYDNLIELFGGPPTPAVGCAPGIDRIALAMEMLGLYQEPPPTKYAIVIPLESELRGAALRVAKILHEAGIPAEVEVIGRGLSRTLSHASKQGYKYAVILGKREYASGNVVVRDLVREEQREVPIEKLKEFLAS